MRVFRNVCMATVSTAAIALAIPLWAHGLSADVTIGKVATIGSTTLKAGSYHVVVDSKTDEVRFMQDGHVMATAPGKMVKLKSKSPYTDLVFNKEQVQEIQFSGKTEAIRIE